MRYTQEVGVVASAGDAFKPEKVQCMYIAEAAITVGKAVMISVSTSYPFGAAVLTATAAGDHSICGLYEGESESRGAKTTTSGLTGYNALAAETVWITVLGAGVGLIFASTTDSEVAARDAIDYSGGAGIGRKGAAPAATLIAAAIALEAQTVSGTDGTPTDIFVRYM